ncbi:ABC transporter ATP-binding protein [Faecalibaculum rodentium]|jgi:putative ABC transport system ATP-binding protein|uniref:ABC transporter ATP-binding protein n=1 Tax=Faecalibaculum rodentium TaxID=1702221 RepID=UPI001C3E2999|nr:ABC transporter ATP-binding protein [Faecalibaculum rodentium]
MNALEAQDLFFTYKGRGQETPALRGCTLSAARGEFTAVIGKSGSGKTTLLHCLAGLLVPDQGHIRIGSSFLTEMNEEQRSLFRLQNIGLVFQSCAMVPELTIGENLRLPFEAAGLKLDEERLAELKNRLDIADLEDRYPQECSGGQLQRAAIARALAGNPQVILADEPTGNLDQENTLTVFSMLKECQREYGQTVILVTHDLMLAKQADRMVMMEDGRILDS